jgi:carbon monoxide dehydrogenase subunit G
VELQHTFTVPIGVDDAWTAFNDIERIAPCLPGASITSVEGDEFTGSAKVKLGPISLQYNGKGRWASRDAAEYRAVIEASGTDRRGNGTAAATISAHLEPEGSGTRVVVDTDLRITGRPAQFGRGVIQEIGTKLLDQFASCLSERLGQPEEVPTPAEVFGEASSSPDGEPDRDVVAAAGAAEDPTPPDVRADELARSAAATPAVSSAEAARSDPAPPDVPVGDAAGEPGGPSVVFEAADVPDVPTSPPGSAPAASSTPAPAAPATPAPAAELDLGNVLGPVLLRRYGPTAATVVVTAVVTWFVARRRYR